MTTATIRILTLNTWKGDGDYDWRRQLMGRDIHTLAPDVICLQEALRTEDARFDTAGYLADFLGMQMVYAPARKKVRSIDGCSCLSFSGLAILTKNDIDSHWVSQLANDDPDDERIALTVHLLRGREAVTVTNVHLTHRSGKDDLRLAQFTGLVDACRPKADSSYWLCCGDYNFAIDCQLREALGRRLGLTLIDCYLAGGGCLPGTTLASASQSDPAGRIDYIFYLQRQGQSPLSCTNSRVVLDEADFEGCFPSDHFGVCVDIALPCTPQD